MKFSEILVPNVKSGNDWEWGVLLENVQGIVVLLFF